jgi:hypothetical protein
MAIKGARKSDLELQWGIDMSKGIEHLLKLFSFCNLSSCSSWNAQWRSYVVFMLE